MPKEQILTTTGEELSRVLGEVLINEDKAHEPNLPGNMCERCFISFRWPDSPMKDADCPAKNTIPLDDWKVAMKWRDWAVAEHSLNSFLSAMYDVLKHSDVFVRYGIALAKPHHYIQAAALCKVSA